MLYEWAKLICSFSSIYCAKWIFNCDSHITQIYLSHRYSLLPSLQAWDTSMGLIRSLRVYLQSHIRYLLVLFPSRISLQAFHSLPLTTRVLRTRTTSSSVPRGQSLRRAPLRGRWQVLLLLCVRHPPHGGQPHGQASSPFQYVLTLFLDIRHS